MSLLCGHVRMSAASISQATNGEMEIYTKKSEKWSSPVPLGRAFPKMTGGLARLAIYDLKPTTMLYHAIA